MLVFKSVLKLDVRDTWTKYTGYRTDLGFDLAVYGNFLIWMNFHCGLFKTKIKYPTIWNVETGEKSVFLFDYKLDEKQLVSEAVEVKGDHSVLLKIIFIAAGEPDLGDDELNAGLKRTVSKNNIPFYLSRVPLTRGLQVLDENGELSTLEKLMTFLVE